MRNKADSETIAKELGISEGALEQMGVEASSNYNAAILLMDKRVQALLRPESGKEAVIDAAAALAAKNGVNPLEVYDLLAPFAAKHPNESVTEIRRWVQAGISQFEDGHTIDQDTSALPTGASISGTEAAIASKKGIEDGDEGIESDEQAETATTNVPGRYINPLQWMPSQYHKHMNEVYSKWVNTENDNVRGFNNPITSIRKFVVLNSNVHRELYKTIGSSDPRVWAQKTYDETLDKSLPIPEDTKTDSPGQTKITAYTSPSSEYTEPPYLLETPASSSKSPLNRRRVQEILALAKGSPSPIKRSGKKVGGRKPGFME